MEQKQPSCVLRISKPNEKIPHYNFNLPAGFTCPYASSCHSRADRETGKITDFGSRGDEDEDDFRCYAASQEALYPDVRKLRWSNFDALTSIGKTNVNGMAKAIINAIEKTMPRAYNFLRLHVSGDFFNRPYLNAWIKVAQHFPQMIFYTYSKSVPFFIGTTLPDNFRVTFSKGGTEDDLIDQNKLKFAVVVFNEEEAANYVWYDKSGKKNVGLEIDHDDSHAWKDNKPFALLIHGVQPKGSVAAKALKDLGGIAGKSSYGPGKRKSLRVIENFSFKEWLAYNML